MRWTDFFPSTLYTSGMLVGIGASNIMLWVFDTPPSVMGGLGLLFFGAVGVLKAAP